MAGTKRLGWTAVTAAAVLSITLLGAAPPADTGSAARGDATRLPYLAAPAGGPNAPAWPHGRFTSTGAGTATAVPKAAAPADGTTLTDVRPQLTATGRQGAAAYEFVLSTGDSPRTGQVTSSGWVKSPRWQVPAGLLKDGGHYTWTVRTKDRSGRTGRDAEARSFTVDQRLGAQEPGGPSATDSLGPVTVALATGNVTASVNTAQVATGSGNLGATFRYDAQAASTVSGLTGAYYPGDSATGIGAGDRPVAERTDARVDFRWAGGAPYPQAEAGAAFRVRWTGRLAVPADGSYRFGGSHDGGLRVLIDGRAVLDDWKGERAGERPVYGTAVRLRAGETHRVTVEYRGPGEDGRVALWAADAHHAAPVPASWLQPSAAVLPPGWTVTPAATGADTASAANAAAIPAPAAAPGTSATAQTPAPGTSATAGEQSVPPTAGPATGTPPGAAARSAAGNQGDDATGDATAEGQTAGVAAAEETGTSFVYAGDDDCADDRAPAGYVCAVRVPGAGTTQLYYRDGKLVRVVNPGRETTDFGYTADHRLTAVRPPLVMDWIASGAGRDTEAAQYTVGYRGDSATAARVTGPDPAGTDASSALRPRHDYTVAGSETRVSVAGVPTPQGWTRKVTHDDAGRVATDTDGTRRTTRFTWTADGRPLTRTEPDGRLTTTVYDDATQMPAGTYGPGPQKCFGTDLRLVEPAPEGCARIPAQTTAYSAAGITTVRADSDGVPALTTRTELSELGLPAALVTDPDGLRLTTAYAFDEAFRPAAETSPAGTRKTFGYYGAEESADNPCTPESDPAPQRGLPKSLALPAGADGSARVEKFVYSERGLPVAVTFGGPDWTCVRYDDRGSIQHMSMPGNANLPAWSVDYDSAWGGDPLTLRASQHDHSMTSTVDLLGRTVAYTDGQGVRTTTGYDRAGRAVLERVDPPAAADAPQIKRTRYDAAGRVQDVVLDGRSLARAGYDTAGTLADVRYANGTRLTVRRDPAGRITAKDWTLADGTVESTRVTRSRSGTVVDESVAGTDARPDGPNFGYDAAGRLVHAFVTGHEYTRDFTADAPAGCPDGTRPGAGANGNVVRLTDRTARGTAVTGYCYDAADRLLATTGDHPVTDAAYALNGHLTGYRADGERVTQRQDAVERHLGAVVTGPGAADVRYTKDIADHLMARTATTADGTERLGYGHTDMAEPSPHLVLDDGKRLLARVVDLPGGVVLTLDPHGRGAARTTWSHPTVRGDIFRVTGDDGRRRGDQYQYGLYGEPLRADGTVDARHLPDNLPGDFDYGWLGQYQVGTEHQGSLLTVVLDTRVLNTAFGRFSAPVFAGPFLNPYEYAAGDPVNHTSINGYDLDVEKE
ncbi:PA14 domain-containing protein [Streptomyces sp. NPDC005930]|uniref:PA14 domain-containing protein n=1 Tax=Streptomyces sp. NPDC005930 TaxID=3364736 RepID=UPI0036B926DD